MTHAERRVFLLQALLREQPRYSGIEIPAEETEQKDLLRALFNLRMPEPVSEEFLAVQDAYLREETRRKGITDVSSLTPMEDGICLWQGDITTLRCDAIVNAANSQMLGCFCPWHGCIDNAIHTFAGVQLRLACHALMTRQGHAEAVGQAKLTPAFNLPCKYVLHTVGPVISGSVTRRDRDTLAACYRACLELADAHAVKSVAFCCISTGEFHFPQKSAAKIAIQTVRAFLRTGTRIEKVVFNVFKREDYDIYRKMLHC